MGIQSSLPSCITLCVTFYLLTVWYFAFEPLQRSFQVQFDFDVPSVLRSNERSLFHPADLLISLEHAVEQSQLAAVSSKLIFIIRNGLSGLAAFRPRSLDTQRVCIRVITIFLLACSV